MKLAFEARVEVEVFVFLDSFSSSRLGLGTCNRPESSDSRFKDGRKDSPIAVNRDSAGSAQTTGARDQRRPESSDSRFKDGRRGRPIAGKIKSINLLGTQFFVAEIAYHMPLDDWQQFANELWGLTITTWEADPEREGTLPEPLDYDIMQDALVELESGQRQMVLQELSCYQVDIFLLLFTKLSLETICLSIQIFTGRKKLGR